MNVYDFEVKQADDTLVSLKKYEGKVLVILNTASFCGYTKQLLGLERLYKEYKEKGLEILAFPVNQFKNQEPETIELIVNRYQKEYGVTFPIFNKTLVNGEKADPLFVFLKDEIGFDPATHTPEVMIPHYEAIDPNYKNTSAIKWNFTKFVVDKKGNPRYRFEPEVTPSNLEDVIKELLSE